jgi:hypothetical protein
MSDNLWVAAATKWHLVQTDPFSCWCRTGKTSQAIGQAPQKTEWARFSDSLGSAEFDFQSDCPPECAVCEMQPTGYRRYRGRIPAAPFQHGLAMFRGASRDLKADPSFYRPDKIKRAPFFPWRPSVRCSVLRFHLICRDRFLDHTRGDFKV